MESILLIGGGGHCKSVIDTIIKSGLYSIYGIIDLKDNIGNTINNIKIIDSDDNLEKYFNEGVRNAFITVGSIGNPNLRIKLYDIGKKYGFNFPTIIDSSAIIAEDVLIEEGTFVGKGAIINTGCSIGKNCIINTGSIVEHECNLGNFVHISPGAVLCGGVNVGNLSHIGANSTVIQYKSIGESVIIGAASVITKNIKDSVKVYGNPGREVE